MFDLVVSFMEKTGYAGVFLLMLAETIFPPFPSEVIMPVAGFAAASGNLTFTGVLLAGTGGSLLGAAFWYFVGLRIGLERLKNWSQRRGRWLTLSPDEIDRSTVWFRRHCAASVLFGRLIPTVRTLISLPAGITRMAWVRFLLYSAVGTALWSGALAGAGYLLGNEYEQVSYYLNTVTNIVFAAIAGIYVYRVVTFKRCKASEV